MQTQKIDLPVNVPVAVALASLAGEKVPSGYSPGSQYLFRDENGGRLYVPLEVGDRITELRSPCIRLTKAKPPHGGRIEWKVEPLDGIARDGTLVIPKEKPDLATSPEFAKPGSSQLPTGCLSNHSHSQVNQTLPEPDTARKRYLWKASRELVDAHAALVKYAAEKHPGVLTSYDIRTLLVTAFINSKNGKMAGGR